MYFSSFVEKWAAVADICRCLHNFNGVLQVRMSHFIFESPKIKYNIGQILVRNYYFAHTRFFLESANLMHSMSLILTLVSSYFLSPIYFRCALHLPIPPYLDSKKLGSGLAKR